jgi:TPP-dependent pyruvate/acetoin dehydrogenase alpha subunit
MLSVLHLTTDITSAESYHTYQCLESIRRVLEHRLQQYREGLAALILGEEGALTRFSISISPSKDWVCAIVGIRFACPIVMAASEVTAKVTINGILVRDTNESRREGAF